MSRPSDPRALSINSCIQANSVCSPLVAFYTNVDQFIPETAWSINKKKCHPSRDIGYGMSCGHASRSCFHYFCTLRVFGWITVCNEFSESRSSQLCQCTCRSVLSARARKQERTCFLSCISACVLACTRVCHQWGKVAVPCSLKLFWLLFHWLTARGAHALLH